MILEPSFTSFFRVRQGDAIDAVQVNNGLCLKCKEQPHIHLVQNVLNVNAAAFCTLCCIISVVQDTAGDQVRSAVHLVHSSENSAGSVSTTVIAHSAVTVFEKPASQLSHRSAPVYSGIVSINEATDVAFKTVTSLQCPFIQSIFRQHFYEHSSRHCCKHGVSSASTCHTEVPTTQIKMASPHSLHRSYHT